MLLAHCKWAMHVGSGIRATAAKGRDEQRDNYLKWLSKKTKEEKGRDEEDLPKKQRGRNIQRK